jgi:hypothetical protein
MERRDYIGPKRKKPSISGRGTETVPGRLQWPVGSPSLMDDVAGEGVEAPRIGHAEHRLGGA